MTAKEAGVRRPQNDEEAAREISASNPHWDESEFSFRYWFRMVNWWNDGKNVGFYFLKVEEGAWLPSYCGDIDRGFFKVVSGITSRPATGMPETQAK